MGSYCALASDHGLRRTARRSGRFQSNTGPTRSRGGLWVGPVSGASRSGMVHRARGRDLAVNAEAIMTSTAATAMAMSQRTQSMPGLPSPPNAV